jgi:hypothetical protein
MYFILEANNSLKKIRHLRYDGAGWGLDFLKDHLVELPKTPNNLFVTFECNKIDLPDFFEVDGVPVANEKLIKAFKVAGDDNFQAFPVELHFIDSKIIGYYVFNILGRISCIDADATKCRKFGPSIMRIFDLKLKPESALSPAMFRDKQYQMVIFVSESIKKMIESENILGCDIREANGWNDSHRF